jgi:putative IMPACT (imprinted ancient) family translation regulator
VGESFRTVAGPAEASWETRGSRFTGSVAPAGSPAEAEAFVAARREERPDATHVVPAYRVPADPDDDRGRLREYANDDGEPGGSAGKPALGILKRREVRNVVLAVARDHGGVNLGVGGLARAYARSASAALDAAKVVERRARERVAAAVSYDDSGVVRSVLESVDVPFEADYDAEVRFVARPPADEAAALRDRLRSATSGRVRLE